MKTREKFIEYVKNIHSEITEINLYDEEYEIADYPSVIYCILFSDKPLNNLILTQEVMRISKYFNLDIQIFITNGIQYLVI